MPVKHAFPSPKTDGADATLVRPSNWNADHTIGSFELTGDITPVQITANQNDYNPSGLSTASVVRLNSSASWNISGLAGGTDGRVLYLYNAGAADIWLLHDDAASAAANRIYFPDGIDFLMDVGGGLTLIYDGTGARWRSVGGAAAAAGGIHGAALHTDTERMLYLDAREQMQADATTNVDLGTAPNICKVRGHADAATSGIGVNLVAPTDYVAGSVVGIQVAIAGDGAAAANVRLRLTYYVNEVGVAVSTAGTDVLWTQAMAAETNLLRETTRQNFSPSTLAAGDQLRLWIYRLGTDAADTYTGVLRSLGMKVFYTSGG
jgi:hypothetical protein